MKRNEAMITIICLKYVLENRTALFRSCRAGVNDEKLKLPKSKFIISVKSAEELSVYRCHADYRIPNKISG